MDFLNFINSQNVFMKGFIFGSVMAIIFLFYLGISELKKNNKKRQN